MKVIVKFKIEMGLKPTHIPRLWGFRDELCRSATNVFYANQNLTLSNWQEMHSVKF